MKIACLVLLFIANVAWAASSTFQTVAVAGAATHGILPMANGSVAIFGSVNTNCLTFPNSVDSCNQTQAPLLSILYASGNLSWGLENSSLGSGNSTILGAAVDASGYIWITGETNSDDFPLLHPFYSTKAAYATAYFVAKLAYPGNILFASFLGNPGLDQALLPTTYPTIYTVNVALDSSGNAWIAGNTTDPNFPVTGPVLGAGSPSSEELHPVVFAFVAKISADASTLLSSRLLGGDQASCNGSTVYCGVYTTFTTPLAITLDATGSPIVAGGTNASNFPITASAYNTGGGAFVTRISADGTQLLWSTETGIVEPPVKGPFISRPAFYSDAQSVTVDPAGNVYVAGSAPIPIATTSGTLQSTPPGNGSAQIGFATKLSSDATKLLYATNLGGSQTTTLRGLTLDPTGNAWVTGNTSSPDFPGINNPTSISIDFALELNANASALQQIFQFVPSTTDVPPAFDSNGSLLLLGSAGNLFRLNAATLATAPSISALTNAAVPRATAGVAPGEIVTLYGVGLGPSSGIVATPDQNGLYPTQLAGVSIEFNAGLGPYSAPLLFVGPGQINFQVPFSAWGGSLPTMTVTTPSGALPAIPFALTGSIGIFMVENQDGSINSASNPAKSGSVVSLFATGLGSPNYGSSDGSIAPAADFAFPNIIVSAINPPSSNYDLPLLYAGTAPGEVNGLDQINVQLLTDVPNTSPNPLLQVTSTASSGVTQSNIVTVYTQ